MLLVRKVVFINVHNFELQNAFRPLIQLLNTIRYYTIEKSQVNVSDSL